MNKKSEAKFKGPQNLASKHASGARQDSSQVMGQSSGSDDELSLSAMELENKPNLGNAQKPNLTDAVSRGRVVLRGLSSLSLCRLES